ncbi:MAG: sigma 54-interacting transcriptional regulator [Sulfurimonas sp.]|nr:sigma 54-interacting transcriptional regulator [Sulfurimonas sp.]
MVVTSFIAKSNASKEAFKTATLLKTLHVNSLITGESGVGKKTLAQYIFPQAPLLDASKFDELLLALKSNSQIIITNLQDSPNLTTLINSIKSHNIRVIATAKYHIDNENVDELFSVKFDIPPLAQREEDVKELIATFLQEASVLFGIYNEVDMDGFTPDLTLNSHSLKKQVMVSYLLQNIKDTELMDIIEKFLFDKIGSNSDYRDFLYLYEVPLIKAGLSKFKSQLQLSDKLGLNRNTLRKKIADNKKYLR